MLLLVLDGGQHLSPRHLFHEPSVGAELLAVASFDVESSCKGLFVLRDALLVFEAYWGPGAVALVVLAREGRATAVRCDHGALLRVVSRVDAQNGNHRVVHRRLPRVLFSDIALEAKAVIKSCVLIEAA